MLQIKYLLQFISPKKSKQVRPCSDLSLCSLDLSYVKGRIKRNVVRKEGNPQKTRSRKERRKEIPSDDSTESGEFKEMERWIVLFSKDIQSCFPYYPSISPVLCNIFSQLYVINLFTQRRFTFFSLGISEKSFLIITRNESVSN